MYVSHCVEEYSAIFRALQLVWWGRCRGSLQLESSRPVSCGKNNSLARIQPAFEGSHGEYIQSSMEVPVEANLAMEVEDTYQRANARELGGDHRCELTRL